MKYKVLRINKIRNDSLKIFFCLVDIIAYIYTPHAKIIKLGGHKNKYDDFLGLFS